jgi:hypothetical protein
VLGLLAEVAVAIAFPNEGGVIPTGLTIAIRCQVRVTRDAELSGDTHDNGGGHLGRVGEEVAEEPRGDDLQGQSEAVMVAAPIRQKLAIGVVEVEVTRELLKSRLTGVAAVAASLIISEELNGHGPQELRRIAPISDIAVG